MKKFTFVDLFAGIGGFHQAFKQLGGECHAMYEIDKYARQTYAANHDARLFLEDVNTPFVHEDYRFFINIAPPDLLSAGFPCQSFSGIGKRKGFEDPRGQLVWAMIDRIKEWQPRAILLENVKGLVNHDKGKTLQIILDALKEAGYDCQWRVLKACDYGLPTLRPRLYIVGFRGKHNFQWPERVPLRFTFGEIIGESNKKGKTYTFSDLREGQNVLHSWDLLECSDKEKMVCLTLLRNRRKKRYGRRGDGNAIYISCLEELCGTPDIADAIKSLLDKGIIKRFEMNCYDFAKRNNSSGIDGIYKLHESSIDVYPTLTASTSRDYIIPHKSTISDSLWEFHQRRKTTNKAKGNGFGYNLVNETTEIAHTLTARYQRDGGEILIEQNNANPRKITIDEAKKMMGFPDDFNFPVSNTQAFKQLGNSVAVDVVYHIANRILDELD